MAPSVLRRAADAVASAAGAVKSAATGLLSAVTGAPAAVTAPAGAPAAPAAPVVAAAAPAPVAAPVVPAPTKYDGLLDNVLTAHRDFISPSDDRRLLRALSTPSGRLALHNNLLRFIQDVDEIKHAIENDANALNQMDPPQSIGSLHAVEPWLAYLIIRRALDDTYLAATSAFGRVVEEPPHENFDLTTNSFNLAFYRILEVKLLAVLALSSVIYTYAYVPGKSDETDTFVSNAIERNLGVTQEVELEDKTFMFVTFVNPETANAFDALVARNARLQHARHWIHLVRELTPNDKINPQFYFRKFTTPAILGQFFEYHQTISGEYELDKNVQSRSGTKPRRFVQWLLPEENP